jgi:hypothetical protein
MTALLSNFDLKSDAQPAVFIAGFNHSHERANFARFAGVVDRPNRAQFNVPGMERQPQFFSENMASLSSTLAAVGAERVTVRTDGAKVLQTVTYEWSQ